MWKTPSRTPRGGLDVDKREAAILLRHPDSPPKIRVLLWWRLGRDDTRKIWWSIRDQANFPTQYQTPQAQARFPRSDEDPGGPLDNQEPANQGPRSAVGLAPHE
jgi:hypothetical protein